MNSEWNLISSISRADTYQLEQAEYVVSNYMKWMIIIFALIIAMLVGNLLMLRHINKNTFKKHERQDKDWGWAEY